jgi:hypothetical protein
VLAGDELLGQVDVAGLGAPGEGDGLEEDGALSLLWAGDVQEFRAGLEH